MLDRPLHETECRIAIERPVGVRLHNHVDGPLEVEHVVGGPEAIPLCTTVQLNAFGHFRRQLVGGEESQLDSVQHYQIGDSFRIERGHLHRGVRAHAVSYDGHIATPAEKVEGTLDLDDPSQVRVGHTIGQVATRTVPGQVEGNNVHSPERELREETVKRACIVLHKQ